jgi:hypothetical protein
MRDRRPLHPKVLSLMRLTCACIARCGSATVQYTHNPHTLFLKLPMLQIQDVYPGSRVKKTPDPESGTCNKEFKYF